MSINKEMIGTRGSGPLCFFQKIATAAIISALFLTPAVSAPAPQEASTFIKDVVPNYRTDEIPVIRSDAALFDFIPEGKTEQIKLTGIYPERSFRFYSPKDEIISKVTVTLKYTPSPSLIPQQSQLNIFLNGQIQKSLPITKEQLGNAVTQTVELNTKNIEESNRMTIEFVGVYTNNCGNIANPSLWLTIDDSSYMSFNTQKLRLANDLSLMPAPFANNLSPNATTLPVVFNENPSPALKKASGIFASWIGTKTEWRGAEFPVYIKEVPQAQNFVVFATNDSRPEFLKNLPAFTGPFVTVVDAPNSLYAKVLVIGGKDEAEVLTAAEWLAVNSQVLTGSSAEVKDFKPLPNREAYDAPNWIPTNDKVTFEKIAKYRGQLRSSGLHPAPISLEVRLPPDLYMVNKSNVDLDLRYRYTKPTSGEAAQMRFLLNEQLVESFELDPKKNSSSFTSRFSLLNGLANMWNDTSVPTGLLGADNLMQFDFQYGLAVPGGSVENCKSVALIPSQVEIDPTSTIDFSGFYHFAKLPNLNLFTVSGFPFTKYADLSETGVVLAKDAPAAVLTTYLNTMARLAAQTSYPATKLTVVETIDKAALKDKDILVFGENSRILDGIDKEDAGVAIDKIKQGIEKSLTKTASDDKNMESVVAEDAGIAAIVQYQSPFSDDRSVVAVLGDGQDGSFLINKRLMIPGDLKLIDGSVAVFKTNATPTSYNIGPTYYTGSLPWHQRIWYSMLDQPVLLVLFTLVCALLFAGGIYYLMHSLIRYRSRRHK